MPELPEVETTLRALRVIGRTIMAARGIDYLPTIAPASPEALDQALRGRQIIGAFRRGKYLLFALTDDAILSVHLRMSGRLLRLPGLPEADRHTRLILDLDDATALVLRDPRKFARVRILSQAEFRALDATLGPEPFDICRDAEAWKARLSAHGRRGLKALLMDQRFVAGIGNIYADEALFRARLHPLRRAGTLSKAEMHCLAASILEVLEEAIAAEGTTLEDGAYRFGEGRAGNFALRLRVYGRAGKPCIRCGTPVVRIPFGGRSAYYCPSCQQRT
ncbi:MAG: DNA-formamidopyrimidine glycosylase [Chloroflexia bacterium]